MLEGQLAGASARVASLAPESRAPASSTSIAVASSPAPPVPPASRDSPPSAPPAPLAPPVPLAPPPLPTLPTLLDAEPPLPTPTLAVDDAEPALPAVESTVGNEPSAVAVPFEAPSPSISRSPILPHDVAAKHAAARTAAKGAKCTMRVGTCPRRRRIW